MITGRRASKFGDGTHSASGLRCACGAWVQAASSRQAVARKVSARGGHAGIAAVALANGKRKPGGIIRTRLRHMPSGMFMQGGPCAAECAASASAAPRGCIFREDLMNARVRLRSLTVLLVLACGLPSEGRAEGDWRDHLRRSAIETIKLSPDGKHLAIAERGDTGTVVVVRDRRTLQESVRFNPGTLGEVAVVKWIDNDRLAIGANRADTRYRIALIEPALYIVGRDGRSKARMPANFLATIDGDPEHLLVTRCSYAGGDGCIDQVHKVEVGHTTRAGDLVISAPDARSELVADRKGEVRFAISWNDESRGEPPARAPQDGRRLDPGQRCRHVRGRFDPAGHRCRWPACVPADRTQARSVHGGALRDRRRETQRRLRRCGLRPDLDDHLAAGWRRGRGRLFDPVRPRPVLWNAATPTSLL